MLIIKEQLANRSCDVILKGKDLMYEERYNDWVNYATSYIGVNCENSKRKTRIETLKQTVNTMEIIDKFGVSDGEAYFHSLDTDLDKGQIKRLVCGYSKSGPEFYRLVSGKGGFPLTLDEMITLKRIEKENEKFQEMDKKSEYTITK